MTATLQDPRIDAIFAPYDRADVPGAIVGIAHRGVLIHRAAYGMASLEHGVANQPTTPMPIGSVTKQFTCAALLALAASGALSLDDALAHWLPAFSANPATLRQLMTHTGGVPCYLEQALFNDHRPLPQGAPMAIQLRQPAPDFTPGTVASYSNGGYLLLSAVIERASGMALEAFLQQAVFAPAGMHPTFLHRFPMQARVGLATPYLSPLPDAGGNWRRASPLMEEFLGDGGLVSTVDDMLRWAHVLRGQSGPSILAELATPTMLANGAVSTYGLGLICEPWRGARTVQHVGALPGACSLFEMLPDHDLDIVVLCNRNADIQALGQRIVAALLGDRLDPEPPRPATVDHADLLGNYFEPETGLLFSFTDLDGTLGFSGFGNAAFPLDGAPAEPGLLPFQTEVNLGPLRFAASPRADALACCDGGVWREARRIDAGRDDTDAAGAGWYTNAATCAQLRLDRSGGDPVVHVRGAYGAGTCPARPVGPDMIRFCSRHFGGGRVARLRRTGDTVDAIIVSGPRTRGLVFARDSAGSPMPAP